LSSTEQKKRRQFFVIVAIGLLVLSAGKFYHHKPSAIRFVIAASVFLTLEFLLPKAASAVFRLWMKFAHVLGAINTRILIALVYFVVITPLGFMVRNFSKPTSTSDSECRKRKSSWNPLTLSNEPSSYENSY
jgi:hypothetical protein